MEKMDKINKITDDKSRVNRSKIAIALILQQGGKAKRRLRKMAWFKMWFSR